MNRLFQLFYLIGVVSLSTPAMAESESGGAPDWAQALTRMPLKTKDTTLNRDQFAQVLLESFQESSTAKSLILMPGATDEFYFFNRAKAELPENPTLWSALVALTNQTRIRMSWQEPHILIHAEDDPITPLIRVEYEKFARKLKQRPYLHHFLLNDQDWNYVQPILEDELQSFVLPPKGTSESWHFFRHAMAGWNLSQMEALEALSLANKTVVTIRKAGIFGGGKVVFEGDLRGTALEKSQQ